MGFAKEKLITISIFYLCHNDIFCIDSLGQFQWEWLSFRNNSTYTVHSKAVNVLLNKSSMDKKEVCEPLLYIITAH